MLETTAGRGILVADPDGSLVEVTSAPPGPKFAAVPFRVDLRDPGGGVLALSLSTRPEDGLYGTIPHTYHYLSFDRCASWHPVPDDGVVEADLPAPIGVATVERVGPPGEWHDCKVIHGSPVGTGARVLRVETSPVESCQVRDSDARGSVEYELHESAYLTVVATLPGGGEATIRTQLLPAYLPHKLTLHPFGGGWILVSWSGGGSGALFATRELPEWRSLLDLTRAEAIASLTVPA